MDAPLALDKLWPESLLLRWVLGLDLSVVQSPGQAGLWPTSPVVQSMDADDGSRSISGGRPREVSGGGDAVETITQHMEISEKIRQALEKMRADAKTAAAVAGSGGGGRAASRIRAMAALSTGPSGEHLPTTPRELASSSDVFGSPDDLNPFAEPGARQPHHSSCVLRCGRFR